MQAAAARASEALVTLEEAAMAVVGGCILEAEELSDGVSVGGGVGDGGCAGGGG